jgi:drug/metabolite transporter (DMT)-like permease
LRECELERKAPPRYRADLSIIAISFVWGSTFVVVKEALKDASTLAFLALRFSLAALVLGVTFRRAIPKIRSRQVLLWSVFIGLFLYLGYVLQTVGLRYTTPSKSAFLTGLSIVLVPVFAAVFERKPPGPSEVLGVVVATAGMGLMTLRRESLSIGRGDLLTIGCAAAFAVHILLIGHFSPKLGFQVLTLVQVSTAAVLALGTCWWAEPASVHWTRSLVAAIVVTGLFATALAFSVQAWAQQYTTATRTALIFSMEPVFAWLTSFAVEGEVLSRQAALGAVLILSGILLVELKPVSFGRNGT